MKIDNVNYISTYFPVQGSEGYEQTLQEIRNILETIIHGQAKNEVVIIGGDFKAKIGTGNENNGHVYHQSTGSGTPRLVNRERSMLGEFFLYSLRKRNVETYRLGTVICT